MTRQKIIETHEQANITVNEVRELFATIVRQQQRMTEQLDALLEQRLADGVTDAEVCLGEYDLSIGGSE